MSVSNNEVAGGRSTGGAFTRASSLGSSIQDCSICQDPLEDCTTVLPCGHKFDDKCIRKWIFSVWQPAAARKRCPMCRTVMLRLRRPREPTSGSSENEGALTPDSFAFEDITWPDDPPNNGEGETDPILDLINLLGPDAPNVVENLLRAFGHELVNGIPMDLIHVMYELTGPQYPNRMLLGNLNYHPTRFFDIEVGDNNFMGKTQADASFILKQLRTGTVSSFVRRIYFTFEETNSTADAIAGNADYQKYARLLTDIPARYHPAQALESALRGTQDDFFTSVGAETRRKTWRTDRRQFTTWTVFRTGQIPPSYGLLPCDYWVELETVLVEAQLSVVDLTVPNVEDDMQEVGYTVQQLQGAIEWLSHPLRNIDQRPGLQRRDLTILLEPSEGLRCKYCNTEDVHRNGDCLFA